MTTIENKILAARTSLLWDHPFFGALAVQLDTVDATDHPAINTMATDGKKLYFHGPFVEELTKDELIFVLAHEVMHNAFEHHTRRQSRDHKLFNIACDYAINGELVETKVGKMPKAGLLDARFTGMGAEEIYRILDEERQQNGGKSGGGDDGSSDPGGCGEVLDGCAQHDEAAIAEARAEMQTKVRQAAAIAKGVSAGNLPAGVKRLIDQLTKPKVDWREILRRFIDENSSRKDFSWARPNRRMLPFRYIMPGQVSDGITHLVVIDDTSGSLDNDRARTAFASELNGAFGDGSIDKVSVIYCDASVRRVEEFENGDLLELRPVGGGGTNFRPAFDWIRDNATDANAIVYFTDMETMDFGDEPAAPVLWAIFGDSREYERRAASAPWGEAVYLEAA